MAPVCLLDDVGSLVVPAEKSWTVQDDLPFFDSRLIVDTCAHFVTASFQTAAASGHLKEMMLKKIKEKEAANAQHARNAQHAKNAHGPSISQAPQPPSMPKPLGKRPEPVGQTSARQKADARDCLSSSLAKPTAPILQAMASHAHGYLGADRLVRELVPRCQPLKQQLIDTCRPICYDIADKCCDTVDHQTIVEHEVNRFLRARLVSVDLADLISYDCFQDVGDGMQTVKVAQKQHLMESIASVAQTTERRRVSQQIHNRRGALLDEHEIRRFIKMEQEPAENLSHKEGFEFVVKRFELRFWRNFINGLANALFGSDSVEMVGMFEENCQAIYTRFGGELQLSINSLMGWLPSYISDSLFIAFTGLGAGVAVRQPLEKFVLLHRCLKSILHSSGRYVLVCTPAWYLPMVQTLPLAGEAAVLKSKPGDMTLSLRSLWPASCLDPLACLQAVDAIWGGAKKGVCAKQWLHPNIEPLGRWVLRMTSGCEGLFSCCLQVIKSNFQLLESVYDEGAQEFEENMRTRFADYSREKLVTEYHKLINPLLDLADDKSLEVNFSGDWQWVEKDAFYMLMDSKVDSLRLYAATWHRRVMVNKRETVFARRQTVRQNIAEIEGQLGKGWTALKGKFPCKQRSAMKPTRKGSISNGTIAVDFSAGRKTSITSEKRNSSLDSRSASKRDICDSHEQPLPRRGSLLGLPQLRRMTQAPAIPTTEEENVEGDDGIGGGGSLLSKLRSDTQGLARSAADGPSRLRKSIKTGTGWEAIEWPIGLPGAFGGRIPIHDSPDLLPTAPPPIIDDDFLLSPALEAQTNQPIRAADLSRAYPPARDSRSPVIQSPSPQNQSATPDQHRTGRATSPTIPTRRSNSRASRASRASRVFSQYTEKEADKPLSPAPWPVRSASSSGTKHLKLKRSSSMPDPSKKEDFNKTLKEFLKRAKRHSVMDAAPKLRMASAPPRANTTAFAHGDATKNSVIALALQRMMKEAMRASCDTEGPLCAAWRQPHASEDLREVQRVQLSVGIIILFAAWRAPLHAWSELPLRHFTSVGGQHLQKENEVLQDVAKVSIPDGIYTAGFTPVYHSMLSETSSRVAPFVAQAFHIDVPHAFLEDNAMEAALTSRSRKAGGLAAARRWREGSTLALLTSEACKEMQAACLAPNEPHGFVRQDHCSVFSLFCAVRVVLGLELMSIWHRKMPEAKDVTVEQFFPFLHGSWARCNALSLRLSLEADRGRPLLLAPWVTANKAGTGRSAQEPWKSRQLYPGRHSESVPLQDFAEWVASLSPGRLVYSSRHSDIGDLYFRLSGAVVVVSFCNPLQPLRTQDVRQMWHKSVGRLEWWGVSLVSFIVLSSSLSNDLEELTLHAGSGCNVFMEGSFLDAEEEHATIAEWAEANREKIKNRQSLQQDPEKRSRSKTKQDKRGPDGKIHFPSNDAVDPGRLVVHPGSEIIVCAAPCLDSFMGDLKSALYAQPTNFATEIAEQLSEEQGKLRKQGQVGRREGHLIPLLDASDRASTLTRMTASTASFCWNQNHAFGYADLSGAKLGASMTMRLKEVDAALSAREARRRLPRLAKPKPYQLDLNFKLMQHLLAQVSLQTKKLNSLVETIEELEAARARDNMPSWLADVENHEVTQDLETVVAAERERSKPTPEAAVVEQPKPTDGVINMDLGWVDCMHDHAANRTVKIERMPSPKQTEKRRHWRPWTPSSKKTLADVDIKTIKATLTSVLHAAKEPILPFDFLGVSGWQQLVHRAAIERAENVPDVASQKHANKQVPADAVE